MSEWREIIDPIAARFEIGAAFNMDVTHNPKGSAAIAKLIREMARIIDDEIEARKRTASSFPPPP